MGTNGALGGCRDRDFFDIGQFRSCPPRSATSRSPAAGPKRHPCAHSWARPLHSPPAHETPSRPAHRHPPGARLRPVRRPSRGLGGGGLHRREGYRRGGHADRRGPLPQGADGGLGVQGREPAGAQRPQRPHHGRPGGDHEGAGFARAARPDRLCRLRQARTDAGDPAGQGAVRATEGKARRLPRRTRRLHQGRSRRQPRRRQGPAAEQGAAAAARLHGRPGRVHQVAGGADGERRRPGRRRRRERPVAAHDPARRRVVDGRRGSVPGDAVHRAPVA
jgi:hypothetical protein